LCFSFIGMTLALPIELPEPGVIEETWSSR